MRTWSRRTTGSIATASVFLVMTLAACGGSRLGAATSDSRSIEITVLAASSLAGALPRIGDLFDADHAGVSVMFSFAGTDSLAAQIEQGAPADIFAGASTKVGDQLLEKGFIEMPTVFCTNRLVLVVPPPNPARILSPMDLARPGVRLVVGAESVPIGAYTRQVLANLDRSYGEHFDADVLSNVVSNEDSAESVLTKVRLGEADAGFVYLTDARAAGAEVHTVPLPGDAQAVAAYPIAPVAGSPHPGVSRQFVEFVLSPAAQRLLRQAGFGPPPRP